MVSTEKDPLHVNQNRVPTLQDPAQPQDVQRETYTVLPSCSLCRPSEPFGLTPEKCACAQTLDFEEGFQDCWDLP